MLQRFLLLVGASVALGDGLPLTLPLCGISDYHQVLQACNTATQRRSGSLQKRPGVACQDNPALSVNFQTTCDCTIDDYTPDILDCPAESTTTQFRPFQLPPEMCSGGVQLDTSISLSVPCPCTKFQATHSECLQDKTRFLIFYHEDGCTPSPQHMPPPPTKVPCDLLCNSGSYLGIDRNRCPSGDLSTCPITCQKCEAGSFSFVGEVYNDFSTWPTTWETGCNEGYAWNSCSSWKAQGDSLWSGDQMGYDSITSWLATHVVVQNTDDAYLQFEYRVESEKTWSHWLDSWMGDRLLLEINGAEVHFTNDSFVAGKMHAFETSWRVPLEVSAKGPVQIKFIYSKDSGDTKYGDAAWIKNIRISGTKPFVTSCELCPSGTFQDDPQSNYCDPCPENTYGPDEGRTACIPCDKQHQWAPVGSTTCFEKEVCSLEKDFIPVRSCVDSRGVTGFKQVNPYCMVEHPVPDETKPECDPCPAGTVPDAASLRRCVPCKSGTYAAVGATECSVCPAGTFGHRVLGYPDFDLLGGEIGTGFYGESWSTTCRGLCAAEPGQGWILVPFKNETRVVTVFNSGQKHGNNFESTLFINLTVANSSLVEFSYALADSATLSVNGTSAALIFNFASNEEETSTEMSLDAGEHTWQAVLPHAGHYRLSWTFAVNQQSGSTSAAPACNLWGLRVSGALLGVVGECEECPPGHYCPEGSEEPLRCAAGSFSAGGEFECHYCPEETVVHLNECRKCGTGSRPSVDFCLPDCTLQLQYGDQLVDYAMTDLNRSLRASLPHRCQIDFDAEGCQWEYDFDIQLCSSDPTQVKNEECVTYEDNPDFAHAFVCQYNHERGVSWVIGANRSVLPGASPDHWTVLFDEGKFCKSAGHRRMTLVAMICDPDGDFDSPRLVQKGEHPSCVYNFEFYGPQACPLCTEDSVQREMTSCENGTQTIRYRRLANCSTANLQDREQLCPVCDSMMYEVCDPQFRRWSRTVYLGNASCWTPGTDTGVSDVLIGRCAQVNMDEANRFTVAFAGLLGMLLLLLLCGTIICCKHRHLQQAYGQLLRRRRAREMTAYSTPFLGENAGDDIFGDDSEEEVAPPEGVSRDPDDMFPGGDGPRHP